MAVAGLRKGLVHDSYLGENYSQAASRRCGNEERSTTRTSSIRKMWRDLESESMNSEDTSMAANEIENKCPQNQEQHIVVQNGQKDDKRLCLQRSPSLDVPEKERVRKVFRDWGSKSYGSHTRMNNCSRAQLEGGNECKRVRIVRDWIESSAQDRSVDLGVGAQRSIRRIYGRQAILDMLAKFVKERKKELDGLLENQFVSNFAHRQRIQSLLKGRFLLNQRFVEDKKQTSVAASELGLLRQTHTVSDKRKGFLCKLNNYDHAPEVARSDSDNDIKYEQAEEIGQHMPDEEFETTNFTSNWEDHNPQEFSSPVGENHDPQSDSDTSSYHDMNIQQAEEIGQKIPHEITAEFASPDIVHFTETRTQNQNDSVEINQVSEPEEWRESVTEDDVNSDESENGWYQETVTTDSQVSHEGWYGQEIPETWFAGNNSYQEAAPSGRSNAFYWSDDDNDSTSELRQLTSRRTVSNLLQSEFGARLEQLMQSYLNRQQQDQGSESEYEAVDNDSVIPETQGENDQEKEIINGLKVDMDILKQRMNEMQTMLDACMDMQHELQRSVQQELCSALNHESESSHGKKGVCFLCCDDGFDSLPNRSGGHVYICSECGEKINWSKVKKSFRNP